VDRVIGPAPGVVYLDHAATSPVRPEVAHDMAPFLEGSSGRFANASGSHRLARDARAALEEARDEVAELLGALPREVIFTGGGTESDNLAVLGATNAVLGATNAVLGARSAPVAVVCSAIEHPAVLEPCRALARGAGGAARHRLAGSPPVELRIAPVRSDGVVDLDAMLELLGPEVALVSIMLANNEVGTVQPVDAIADAVHRYAERAVVHTDAVQAAVWLDLSEAASQADLISVSAHKLGGPKGSGALVVRGETPLEPLVYGGGQERERRSGTYDVAAAVGLASALRATARCRRTEAVRVGALRDQLADGVVSTVPGALETVDRSLTLPGHCHLCFEGVEQEELLVLLDEAGVCASGGAACASGALGPSHVLTAMGLTPSGARSAVRFTLGHTTVAADVETAIAAVGDAVARLRG